jgi:hypothetical protein
MAMGYATQGSGGLPTFSKAAKLLTITSVKEGQLYARDMELSANWIFTDKNGNLGYQQSGKLPDRSVRTKSIRDNLSCFFMQVYSNFHNFSIFMIHFYSDFI